MSRLKQLKKLGVEIQLDIDTKNLEALITLYFCNKKYDVKCPTDLLYTNSLTEAVTSVKPLLKKHIKGFTNLDLGVIEYGYEDNKFWMTSTYKDETKFWDTEESKLTINPITLFDKE